MIQDLFDIIKQFLEGDNDLSSVDGDIPTDGEILNEDIFSAAAQDSSIIFEKNSIEDFLQNGIDLDCIHDETPESEFSNLETTLNEDIHINENNNNEISFEGNDQDQKQKEDNEFYRKQANHAYEESNWHSDQAKKAVERGDYEAAKDHQYTAESWQRTGNDYANKIKNPNN